MRPKRLPPDEIHRLLRLGIRAQRIALDTGDIELTEAYAKATALLLDHHLHGAIVWVKNT